MPSDDTGRQCSSQLPGGGAMSEGSGELEGARGESGPESSLWGRAGRFEEVPNWLV